MTANLEFDSSSILLRPQLIDISGSGICLLPTVLDYPPHIADKVLRYRRYIFVSCHSSAKKTKNHRPSHHSHPARHRNRHTIVNSHSHDCHSKSNYYYGGDQN